MNEALHRGIHGSEWVLLEESSHLAHVEESERYLRTVDDWLDRVEGGAVAPSGA